MQLQVPMTVDPAALLRQIADQIGAAPVLAPSSVPLLGELWPGQGGRFVGTIRDEGSDRVRYVIAPVGDAFEMKGPWGEYGKSIDGAKSPSDGAANTKAMAAAGSEIAKKVLALSADGHADLYIPSRRELSLCEMNARDLFKREWYWSSTQYSSYYAFIQGFVDGTQYVVGKDGSDLVRPVRSFVL